MRRFDYDDEENREEVDKFFGDGEEHPDEEEFFLEEAESLALQEASFDLAYRDLDDRLLFRVIKMLEKGFWCSFDSLNTRMKMIEKAYRRIKRIQEKG